MDVLSLREQVMGKIRDSFPLPPVTEQVVSLLNGKEAEPDKIIAVVEGDRALMSLFLELASAGYSSREVAFGTVSEVVHEIGTCRTCKAVLLSAFIPLMIQWVNGYDLPEDMLWKHSLSVAVLSEELGLALGLEESIHVFASGLMHDIGKVVLGSCFDGDMVPILGVALRERISIDIAEQQVLGVDHAESGAVLLGRWKFPDSVVEVVRWHHQPDHKEKWQIPVDVVHVANSLCYVCEVGLQGIDLKMCPSCDSVKRLRLTTEAADKVSRNAKERVNALIPLFAR